MDKKEYEFSPDVRQAYERLPAAMCVFRLAGSRCRLLLVSDGMCRLLENTREEITAMFSRKPADCVIAEDYNRVSEADVYIQLHPEEEYRASYRMKKSGGTVFWAQCRGRTEKLPDGSLLLYAQYFDIDEERTLSAELETEKRRREILIQNILAASGTAIFWKDADRRFLGVNKAFLDYYGFKDDSEIIGKTDEEMGWHSDPEPFKNDEFAVLHGGKSTYRVHGKCIARGEERDIVATKSPMYVDGKIVGLVGSFDDVTTEYRQKDEIYELNRRLTREIAENEMIMSAANVYMMKLRTDKDLTILWSGGSVYRSTGYTREEFNSMADGTLHSYYKGSEAQFDILMNAMQRARDRNETSFEVNMRMPTRTGLKWIKGVGIFWDYSGSPPKAETMYAIYTDVSDLMSAQEKLRVAERAAERAALLEDENRRLMRIIDNVPSGIGIYKLSPGRPGVMTVNRYFTEKFGITNEELEAAGPQKALSFLHPEDRPRASQDLEMLLSGADMTGVTYRVLRKDGGGYIWIRIGGRVASAPDGGTTVYFAFTNVDAMKKTEMALRDSRKIYEEAVKAARLVVWEYDIRSRSTVMLDDEYSSGDLEATEMPGVAENVPDSLIRYFDEDSIPPLLEMYRQVNAGRDASCEVWFKQKKGMKSRCERIVYTVVNDESGRPLKAYGIGQDLTAQKLDEQKYDRAYRQLQQANSYALCSFMMNLTTNWCGQGQSTVPLAMKVLEPGTVDGCLEELSAMVADEDVKVKFKDTLKREHLLEAFRQGQTRLSIEYPIVYPDGERYWRRGLLSMLQNPRTGDVEAAAAIIDIDLQKKNEQIVDIITKEELEYIGLIHPATGTFEFINKHKAISYGEVGKRLDYEECRRYVGLNFVDSGERAHFEQCTSISAISAGLRENGRWASSYQRTENGRVSRRHLQYRWLDKPEGDILVIRTDITAAYEQEQERLKRVSDALLSAERANEAKSTFLSSMSHDLRTPLNGVIGFTELAIKEADQDKKQDYLEKIRMSGSLLLSLINDTLDLSRIESGKLVLRPEAVDSRELGETVITALRPAAELKNVRIEADQDGFPDETIWVDKLSMQKVLVNLLSNAIKYTLPGGTVTMRVEKLDPPENGRTRRIVVEDSGIGIGPEFIPHLFEPFSQENRPEAGNVAGTGLGLAIVKRIIDLMDGEITVESKLGEGTRFTIDIPLRSAAAGDGTKHGEAVDTVRLDGKKLLMCEDNYLNREIAEIILRQRGALVDCAVNGREGVEKFSASAPGEYAAVLMDMRMPELDGCGAARKIRSLPRPDAAAVPIIAMSADAFDEDMRRAAEAGMDDYVTKPIKAAELYSAIVKQIVRDRGRTPD